MAQGLGARHKNPCRPVWDLSARTAYQYDGTGDGLCAILPLAHFGVLHPTLFCSAQYGPLQGRSLVLEARFAEDGGQTVGGSIQADTGFNAGDAAMGEVARSGISSFSVERMAAAVAGLPIRMLAVRRNRSPPHYAAPLSAALSL